MRKPFKGGTLDSFLEAGEAEAKYGPQRYAAVTEAAWEMEVKKERTEAERQATLASYEIQKARMVSDHLTLSAFGLAAFWSLSDDPSLSLSYAAGAGFGLLYVILKQREADSFGASAIEEVSRGPPSLVAPILMVLIVAKQPALMLLPTLAGFFTNKVATVLQIVYAGEEQGR